MNKPVVTLALQSREEYPPLSGVLAGLDLVKFAALRGEGWEDKGGAEVERDGDGGSGR